jgi:hypothetical protein
MVAGVRAWALRLPILSIGDCIISSNWKNYRLIIAQGRLVLLAGHSAHIHIYQNLATDIFQSK